MKKMFYNTILFNLYDRYFVSKRNFIDLHVGIVEKKAPSFSRIFIEFVGISNFFLIFLQKISNFRFFNICFALIVKIYIFQVIPGLQFFFCNHVLSFFLISKEKQKLFLYNLF